ncbi:MAG TPA: glycosyltransferase family 2 protein [Bacilli bacterium]
MRMTSMIIPSSNGIEMLKECIFSIRQHTPVPYEIIVVDNGSNDGTADFCREQQLTFVSLARHVGFPAACNLGLKLAVGDNLLLLNNDVVVTSRWLENMLDCLYSSDDIGMVGPLMNQVSGKQLTRSLQYDNLAEMQRLARKFNVPNSSEWAETARIVGCCMLMKRTAVEQTGYLDERFTPGHYEDDDYCHRMRAAGFRLMICRDTFLHHHGTRSFRQMFNDAEIDRIIAENYRKFVEKWGFDPHQFL